MPATVNANKLTVVHASSSGISSIFPDVCKTPTPAGPVPIPYPNVAQSSDTADGSTTVKVDGNPIMLKTSNYRMSTGDEAGSVLGVASNKVKGKAEPVLYSFDVKVDGQNVFRLTDMMLQNSGSPPNTPPGTNLQPPNPAIPPREEACDKTHAKKREQKQENTAWGKSGIIDEHRSVIQEVADDEKVVMYFRQTKEECASWIRAKHQPKPHSVLAGTTITAASEHVTQAWLDHFFHEMDEDTARVYPKSHNPRATSKFYGRSAAAFIGVVGSTQEGQNLGKPLRGFGESSLGASYEGKWITGDYDLFQVVTDDKRCVPVCQNGANFARLRKEVNSRLKWDAIQHGPQAQWCPTEEELGDLPLFNMPDQVKGALQTGSDPAVQIAKGRKPMKVIDRPLTVVAGHGVVIALESKDDVADAMICEGCAE